MLQSQATSGQSQNQADTDALVLVIEDDEDLRDMLALNLERHGYRVAVAADGAEGLELARSLTPDLVVLEISLPLVDGFAICRQIREASSVPVMMVTSPLGSKRMPPISFIGGAVTSR